MAGSNVSQGAPQPANIASVFGEPYYVGDKVLIPVAQVALAFARTGGKRATRQVAIIEVSGGRVRIKPKRNLQALVLGIMLAGVWYLYWMLKTAREGQART